MMVLGQYRAVLVGTWGNICWYLVVLDQYGVVMVDTWWYWVSVGRCLLVLGGTGSVWRGTG